MTHTIPVTKNQMEKVLLSGWFCFRWLILLGLPAIAIYGIISFSSSTEFLVFFGVIFSAIAWTLQLSSWFDNGTLKWKNEEKN